MVKALTIKLLAAPAIFHWPASVFAHESHGLSGSHWHASDAWGFVALAMVLAIAVWLTRSDE